MSEKTLKPQIRFKGFTENWEQRNVTELGKIFIGLVTTMTSHYTNSGCLLIRNSDIKDNRFEFDEKPIYLEENFANQYESRMHQIGDVITVHTGDVGTSAVITKNEEKTLGFATIVTRPNPKIVNSNYLSCYFNTKAHKRFAVSISTGDGRNNYNLGDFVEVDVPVPCLDEQEKIADYIIKINSLITFKKNQYEKLKQYKEAMLYKMFPKEGFKVPEIRFKGFEGEWKTRVFEKAFDKLSNNSIKRDLLNYKKGIVKNIHYGDVLIKFGFTVNPSDMEVPYINEGEKVSKNAEDYLITGDVVFADTAEDTTAGKVTEIINPNGVKTLAGLHTYPCRPLDKYVPGFLGIMLNTSLFHNQLIPYMQGTKVTGFNYGQLCKTVIYYPGDEEQKKIVEFFDNLDSKIKNQEKEITILENYKAALLEKMFA